MSLKITKDTLKKDSNYKAKAKRLSRKSMYDKDGNVSAGTFEMHFGFKDTDCAIEEYSGGGLESVNSPKLKESLKDY